MTQVQFVIVSSVRFNTQSRVREIAKIQGHNYNVTRTARAGPRKRFCSFLFRVWQPAQPAGATSLPRVISICLWQTLAPYSQRQRYYFESQHVVVEAALRLMFAKRCAPKKNAGNTRAVGRVTKDRKTCARDQK